MALNPDHVRMSLGEHLEDLRKRLFLGFVGPIILMAILLVFADRIVAILCEPLIIALQAAGAETALRANDVSEAFGAYIRVAFIGGLILGIPWLLYQLWLFVAPGLYPSEQKFIRSLIPGSVVLAVSGVVFMYYVMLPLSLWFLVGFVSTYEMPSLEPSFIQQQFIGDGGPISVTGPEVELPRIPIVQSDPAEHALGQMWVKVPENQLRIDMGNGRVLMMHLKVGRMVEPLITLGNYISFVMWMALMTALAFQLPLIMLMLAWATVVDYALLRKGWRWAILLSVVAGAALSPGGDIVSMLAFTAPLYGLYELGLVLVRMFVRDRPAAMFSGLDAEEIEDDKD